MDADHASRESPDGKKIWVTLREWSGPGVGTWVRVPQITCVRAWPPANESSVQLV